MSWRVSNDEGPPVGGEISVGHIDGDALLALGRQPINKKRKIELTILRAKFPAVGVESGQLVVEDHLGFIKQPAD